MRNETFMKKEFLYQDGLPKLHFPVFHESTIPNLNKDQMEALEKLYWQEWDEAFFAAIFVMDKNNPLFDMRPCGFMDRHVTSEGPSLGMVLIVPCP